MLRWVNAITTVYDTFQQIQSLLNGEVTIGEVIHMIMSDMAIDAMLSWLCNTKLKVVLKPVMAIMAGDAAFKQMKDAWENGSTLDKIMYTAKFAAYVFGLAKQCFTGDTLVWTEHGTVAIADIAIGDEVYTYDAETGEAILAKVTDISVSEIDELVHLTIDGELIRTTAGHPFYTTEGEWKAAGDLMVGERVVTVTGEATVEAVVVEKLSEAVKVYNLTVEGAHNYYVAENGVLVHNSCGESWPRNAKDTSEMNMDDFMSLRDNGVVKVNASGSDRPLIGEPNSFYSTNNGEHVFVYDSDGKLMYDISSKRVKAFKINIDPDGNEHFQPYKLKGLVPDTIMNMFGW